MRAFERCNGRLVCELLSLGLSQQPSASGLNFIALPLSEVHTGRSTCRTRVRGVDFRCMCMCMCNGLEGMCNPGRLPPWGDRKNVNPLHHPTPPLTIFPMLNVSLIEALKIPDVAKAFQSFKIIESEYPLKALDYLIITYVRTKPDSWGRNYYLVNNLKNDISIEK